MIDNRWLVLALAVGLLAGLTPNAAAASDDVSDTIDVTTTASFPCEPEGAFAYVCYVLGLVGETCRDVTGEACFY